MHDGWACVAGGGGCVWQGCMVGRGCVHDREHAWQGRHVWGGMHGGGCAWGVCMAGGMHGRGHAWQGACVAGGMRGRYHEIQVMFSESFVFPQEGSISRGDYVQGGVSVQTGLCLQGGSLSRRPSRYDGRSGGTHSTGMHFWFKIFGGHPSILWGQLHPRLDFW